MLFAIKFFRESKLSEEEMRFLAKITRLEQYQAEDLICLYGTNHVVLKLIYFIHTVTAGDYGEKFYIIIEGEVSVLVPNAQSLLRRQQKALLSKGQ